MLAARSSSSPVQAEVSHRAKCLFLNEEGAQEQWIPLDRLVSRDGPHIRRGDSNDGQRKESSSTEETPRNRLKRAGTQKEDCGKRECNSNGFARGDCAACASILGGTRPPGRAS